MSVRKKNAHNPRRSKKKNYKKHHSTSGLRRLSVQDINGSLERLHQALLALAVRTFGSRLDEQQRRLKAPVLKGEAAEIYTMGLISWIIFHVACLDGKQTIFSHFFAKSGPKLPAQVKAILREWAKGVPSVYEIVSVSADKDRRVAVRDLPTGRLFSIPYREEDDLLPGEMIVGTLVPFADHYRFFYTMIKLFDHDRAALTALTGQYAQAPGGLKAHFPDFLSDVLLKGSKAHEWAHPLHREVADLFARHMVDKNISDQYILRGIALWRAYCAETHASFKKAEAYAAALDYLIQTVCLHHDEVTQGQLAKEYGVAPGTISTNFRRLKASAVDLAV